MSYYLNILLSLHIEKLYMTDELKNPQFFVNQVILNATGCKVDLRLSIVNFFISLMFEFQNTQSRDLHDYGQESFQILLF